MCAAACTVNMADAKNSSVGGSLAAGGGVRDKEKWKESRKDSLGSEGGKGRVRPRDAMMQAEECTPTKRIGGLTGDGKVYC